MSNRYLSIAFIAIFFIAYYSLFYFILNFPSRLDFTSFYAAVLSLKNHENPYGTLFSYFLPFTKELTPNLNPPAVLWIFSPLTKLNYQAALITWVTLSFILGLIGAGLAFYYAFSINFLKKYWVILSLLYLSFFPTMINFALAQMGSFLLFFLMIGYHFFLTNRHFLAGVVWGFIIALKFFPALLFFYAFKQRRMDVFLTMLVSFLLISLIPFIIYGGDIYLSYFAELKRVFWYGDNWNASIYGYIARLFAYSDKYDLKITYLILLLILLGGYLYLLQPNQGAQVNHQPFSFTLAMMLLVSPFGWLYYFPIVIFPLVLGWAIAIKDIESTSKNILLWLLCFFLINLPQNYVITNHMQNFAVRFIFSSFYFYGLLLLNYFLVQKKKLLGKNEISFTQKNTMFVWMTFFIFLFGIIVTTLKIGSTLPMKLLF